MRAALIGITYAALWALELAPSPAQADAQHPATCRGYIATLEAAARSNDPLGPQAYINLADSMCHAINNGVVAERKMIPLLLPDDEDAEAQRAMVVVAECKRDMSFSYAQAVTAAYIKMRRAAGLSIEVSH